MVDLNTLIPADSPLFLIVAPSINASGQITALAVEKSTGKAHAILATPRCDGNHADMDSCKE